jgi:uncharacterized protein YecE (DUF72 family)
VISDSQAIGPIVRLGDGAVYTGSCSWTEQTLVRESDWYPQRSMTAEARLRFYAERFPLTEVDSTYYAPPSEQQATLWAQRTPEGFRFDVKAYSLLTGHPTRPQSLWPDVRKELSPRTDEKRNVYAHHLPPDALHEAWRRFEAALRPLHQAGRLGMVLFQYPPWFTPRRENRSELEALRSRLPDYRLAVEFRSPRWLSEQRDRERTLALLKEHALVFVCVDAPEVSRLPRLLATTNPELAIVRFHGRSDSTWAGHARTAAERFRYLYSKSELSELAKPVLGLAREAAETHLLMNNCYRDYSVRNARQLQELLSEQATAAG